jgi:hypothetical protein
MSLINSIGAYFNKFLGGWTFGTQTDQLTVKNSAEIVGTTGTIYEHTFQNKDGIVAHLDDITISLPTDTTGSILFLNSSNDIDSDGTYFNWDKVNKRLNLKGNSDTVGNIFVAQNLSSNEIFRLQNDRDIVIGGGSASTDTQVTINPYRAAGTSNYVLQVNADANNYMRFINSTGSTDGGLKISRGQISIANRAFAVGSGATNALAITSNGSIAINASSGGALAHIEIGSQGLINSNVAGSNGLYFVTAGTNRGFVFEHLGTGSNNTTQAVFQIRKTFTEASVSSYTERLLNLNGTYDLTNGTKNLIGIDYDMTITALSGAHYGLLIRPNTLNGIGLGASLPTATLHVKGNSGFIYENSDSTRYIRFKPTTDGTEPLDIRTNSTGASVQTLIRNASGNVNLKLASSVGAGYYLSLGSNLSTSVFGYVTEVGLRNFNGLKVQGLHNVLEGDSWGRESGITLMPLGNLTTDSDTAIQSGVAIMTDFTNASIVRPYSFFYFHRNTVIALTSSSVTRQVSAININYQINQTAGSTIFAGIDYNPTVTSITGEHYGLVIRPSGTLNGIGHTTNLPTATWHVKGNSDSVGTIFRAENLSNTNYMTLGNASGLTLKGNSGDVSEDILFQILNGSSNESLYQIRAGEGGTRSYTVTQVFKKSTSISGGDTTMGISNAGGVAIFNFETNGYFRLRQNSAGYPLQLQGPSFTGNMDFFGGRQGVVIGGSILNATTGIGTYVALQITNTINQTGGTGTFTAIEYNPTLTAITGSHYGLLIRPSTLNGFGLGANMPTATMHIKGNSDSVGNMFVAENLSNTASLTIANNGVTTFSFGSGGKVFINAPVEAGDTLLEIRRSVSSSGGFIFRSDNSLTQVLNTTNGSFNIGTVDNSNINLGMGSGVFTISTNPSMSAINTGQRMMLGTLASSSLSRWLNIGYNNTFGQILQSVQNGSTPTSDSLNLNPYGGSVTINAATSGQHANVNLADGNTAFRVYRGSSAASGITMSQTTGGAGVFSIAHGDSTNTSGNANIAIRQGNTAYFYAGTPGQPTRNAFYGSGYGTITDFNTLLGHDGNRGIAFSNSNNTSDPAIIQGLHTSTARTLSLQYYGSNVGIGAIQPTAKLHIRGESDSVGSSFIVQNLSNTTSLNFNNSGNLELRANPGQNFNNLFTIYNGADLSLAYMARDGATGYQPVLRFSSSPVLGTVRNVDIGFIDGGGTPLLHINAGSVVPIYYTSNGHSFFKSHTTGYVLFGNQVSGILIGGTLTPTGSGQTDYGYSGLNISPTINQTTTSGYHAAIDYNPTLTAITGQHFGFLIRPTTLNGIGLGGLGGTLTIKPTSALDIQHTNGYNQFRLRTQYTPTATADTNGAIGDICFDDDYVYYKGTTGWKRGALATF